MSIEEVKITDALMRHTIDPHIVENLFRHAISNNNKLKPFTREEANGYGV